MARTSVLAFVAMISAAGCGVSHNSSTPLDVATTKLPAALVDANYTANLTVADGTAPYTWSVSSGQLPPGLTLQSSTGVVSGQPTKSGSFAFVATVTDSTGDTGSNDLTISVTAAPAPTVTAISPASGQAGTAVTITGTNFDSGATVSFGSVSATSVTVVSATQVKAAVPALGAGPYGVSVANPGSNPGTLANAFTVTTPTPTVTAISPSSGPAGTAVTVYGTNFDTGAKVSFGTAPAPSANVVSSTQLKTSVPSLNSGTYNVSVTDPGASAGTLTTGFTVTAPTSSSPSPTNPSNPTNHYLYAVTSGPVITVYDIDNGFKEVKKVSAASSTDEIRGAVASAKGNFLYISYGCTSADVCTPFLMKYDLLTDTVVWNNVFPPGIDSHSISPDGKTIYMPTGEGDHKHSLWYVLDSSDGNPRGTIDSGETAPHNTIVSNDGTHIYMGTIGRDTNGDGNNHLVQASASDNSVTKRIGPVLNGETRPFTIDANQQFAFIVPFGLNGFQVASISSGKIIYTATVSGFSNLSCIPTVTCSHGISLSPDNKEIYVVDYYNDYVHVFDVSGLPSSPPSQVADIPLQHLYNTTGPWVTHSRDGRFVFVGQSGDVIDTSTRQIVGYIPALNRTKVFTEIDFQNGVVSFTPLSRSGVGYDQ